MPATKLLEGYEVGKNLIPINPESCAAAIEQLKLSGVEIPSDPHAAKMLAIKHLIQPLFQMSPKDIEEHQKFIQNEIKKLVKPATDADAFEAILHKDEKDLLAEDKQFVLYQTKYLLIVFSKRFLRKN